MLKIKYDLKVMKFITLFESVTRSQVKDCIDAPYALTFIVHPMQLGKAIGRNGSNIHKIENMLKRKVKVIEFNENKVQFFKNIIAPAKAEAEEQDNVITVVAADHPTRGIIIGRNAAHLHSSEEIMKRFFPIEKIVVK